MLDVIIILHQCLQNCVIPFSRTLTKDCMLSGLHRAAWCQLE